MMPKSNKTIKKGYDPPGNNYIALGSKKELSSGESGAASLSSSSSAAKLAAAEASSGAAKLTSRLGSHNSASNLAALVSASNSTNETSNDQTNNNGNSHMTSNSITNITNLNSNNNGNSNSSSNQYFIDPRTVKEEITKTLEKEDSNEKLTKIIKSLVVNLKTNSTNSNSTSTVNKTQQQPDLNFLLALGYVSIQRPQLFLKQPTLIEFLCTNLLFSNKTSSSNLDSNKTNASNVSKSKSLQALRPQTPSPTGASSTIQPAICNIIYYLYEAETSWPDLFVKAYIDDSLNERSWVDSPLCRQFVENIKTAFGTRPIPYSTESSSSGTPGESKSSTLLLHSNNSNSSSDLMDVVANTGANEDSLSTEFSSTVMDNVSTVARKSQLVARYANTRDEIKSLVVDTIKSHMNAAGKSTATGAQLPSKRVLGQTINSSSSSNLAATAAAASSSANSFGNRNFLKLLQHTCGIEEVRLIGLSKLEGWLLNSKIEACAQDLLMAICCNCTLEDQIDRELIQQIVKIKPKLKQHQHYFDCIKELIKLNTTNLETIIQCTVRNELLFQQQISLQQQIQQQQQQQQSMGSAKNQHTLNLLQTAFAIDGQNSSKILAQTMQKVLLQRNGDEHVRSLRILLRDTIRNSRHDFDLIKFTNELINDQQIRQPPPSGGLCSFAGGPADFSQTLTRERYVNSICDLITVCILVSITPQIKEAYSRRQVETRDVLIKYYMLMAQIQLDTLTWLQTTVRTYEINPNEFIKCIFKVVFMVDKPEQHYTIDNWPSEQERATLFRVVSDIPVLSETLHQVLLLTKFVPESLYMYMLCVEMNLLKTAVQVHNKDIYSLKLHNMDTFVHNLFSICMYKIQSASSTPTLVVNVLYWRAWEILLLLAALDPKTFGRTAWNTYPTLKLLMEMVMLDDYNYPPQSSVLDEASTERWRTLEAQACATERAEILEFENWYEKSQAEKTGSVVVTTRNETNSQLIGQVMKFDPTGLARRPTAETVKSIRKLNAEYRLGQLLCKSRQPDFLLDLIKTQSSKQSLPWLSSLIESSADCLEILPIQCVCEFVWNLASGTEEEIQLKKQISTDQLLYRIKLIISTGEPSDPLAVQQITDVFDFFLDKLCSDRPAVRQGALKILNKLFATIVDPTVLVDLNELLDSFGQLPAYEAHVRPLLVKHLRRLLSVETNPVYLRTCLHYLFTDDQPNKSLHNDVGLDLANFFLKRDYYLNTSHLLPVEFHAQVSEYVTRTFKLNQLDAGHELLSSALRFDRQSSQSYLLLQLREQFFIYLHERQFNLVVYLILLAGLDDLLPGIKLLNCDFDTALGDLLKRKLLRLDSDSPGVRMLVGELVKSTSLELLVTQYGLSRLTVTLALERIEQFGEELESQMGQLCDRLGLNVTRLTDVLESRIRAVNGSNRLVELLSQVRAKYVFSRPGQTEQPGDWSLFRLNRRRAVKADLAKVCVKAIDVNRSTIGINGEAIRAQVEKFRQERRAVVDTPMVENEQENDDRDKETGKEKETEAQDGLVTLIDRSCNQNLEVNMNRMLNDLKSTRARIESLVRTLLAYETSKQERCIKRLNSNSRVVKSQQSVSVTYKRCVIDILLDYFCHFDAQIVSETHFDAEFRLLFEMRHVSGELTDWESSHSTSLIQPFLLSLFIHQASWINLTRCVGVLFDGHRLFAGIAANPNLKLNPSVALDFISSLIHIPELWKGTETQILQKYSEENVLTLNEKQLCSLLDYIVEEMFVIYGRQAEEDQANRARKANHSQGYDRSLVELLNQRLNRRIQLFTHFLKKTSHSNRHTLFDLIIDHLSGQRELIGKATELTRYTSIGMSLATAEVLLDKIQTLLLYNIYLEENAIIYHIKNPNRMFAYVYHEIDLPTELDLTAHNLLNCFGEIEVNYSNNQTSSGIIGEAARPSVGLKKQEKQEVLQFAKKQEEFMIDANLVLVKLAATHPFIFIRQLPMMEGLLQGRVAYTFDEFKRRKFDKLFHYIIDLLNILVPYTFHRKYVPLIEAIISHYFDVFMSYCTESREFIGSLVLKFVDFLEKFINCDIRNGHSSIIKKYSTFLTHLQKLYPELGALKSILSIETIPLDLLDVTKSSFESINVVGKKSEESMWSLKQLEPFINKLSNRENFENVLTVLQELDAVSQREHLILSHFVFHLTQFFLDPSDFIRDLAILLVMRYVRLYPKHAVSFVQSYADMLASSSSRVFNSAIRYLPDFLLLCSDKADHMMKCAIKNSHKHGMDVNKQLAKSIKLLQLEKYVY